MSALTEIPGVGDSIAEDFEEIGIRTVEDLMGQDAEDLYERHNSRVDRTEDRCLLYVFRCAVYYANTAPEDRVREKLKWWNWKY